MKRRKFITSTATLALASLSSPPIFGLDPRQELILGHGEYKYKLDRQWGQLNRWKYPVKDCHEMVINKEGRIILLTNHIKNNFLVYDRSGKLLDAFGHDFPGAHGLSISDEGEEMLYVCDNDRHELIKCTIKGEIIQVFPWPEESSFYSKKEEFIPTESAIADNGDVYVADGYGKQFIIHYDANGRLKNVFGGPEYFQNAHGIAIDNRTAKPRLIITARQQNKFKYFSLTGEYEGEFHLPGAYVCRPVFHNQLIYTATIWSHNGSADTGFVSIIDKTDHLVSAPGGIPPVYNGNELQKMHQSLQVFKHPHDVCVDKDDNIYVAQWNAGGVYPYKLERV